MIFYLHYIMLTSGLCGTSVLLGVYFKQYSDASQGEIGALLMTFPFVAIIIKPLFCSLADRYQAHKSYLIGSLIVLVLGYAPFAIIPLFPDFYQKTPRLSWYLLVVSCHIGNAGLGVAWSLGDSLAVNRAQKTNTPYGRMRLSGTVSWGIFGYLIGEINETPMLPKYLPAFLVLITNALLEIVLLALWNNSDFEMYDPNQQQACVEMTEAVSTDGKPNQCEANNEDTSNQTATNITLPQLASLQGCPTVATTDLVDSTPSSLGGTLRMNSKTAMAMKSVIVPDDLAMRIKSLELISAAEAPNKAATISASLPMANSMVESPRIVPDQTSISGGSIGRQLLGKLKDTNGSELSLDRKPASTNQKPYDLELDSSMQLKEVHKNPQLVLLRFILTQDGRLVKYLWIFTMFGLLIAPMNFVFLSMVEVCRKKGYNFSQLAGSVIISQASIETLGFLVLPWFLERVSRSIVMTFGLAVLFARYLFYACFYYTADISPYWALVGEWGHGLSYCIFCTIMADVALIFASESRLFIDELRSLGFLSDSSKVPLEQTRIEENAIRIALRATMQALFGGFMDGLGQGSGSFLCGVLAEAYSYITLWQLFTILSVGTLVIHQCIELTRCKWSDQFKPGRDTKAFEIMQHCGQTKSVKTKPPTHSEDSNNDKQTSKLCMVRLAKKSCEANAKPC